MNSSILCLNASESKCDLHVWERDQQLHNLVTDKIYLHTQEDFGDYDYAGN